MAWPEAEKAVALRGAGEEASENGTVLKVEAGVLLAVLTVVLALVVAVVELVFAVVVAVWVVTEGSEGSEGTEGGAGAGAGPRAGAALHVLLWWPAMPHSAMRCMSAVRI